MAIVGGIDVGSLTGKCVLLDDKKEIVASSISLIGSHSRKAGERVLSEALDKAGLHLEDIAYVISTGYGRDVVPVANAQITEISCHAKGANFFCPEVRTVIDIGGQDSKAISVGEKGAVLEFNTNDKCAAGSGRFIEVMAHALEVKLEDMGRLSLESSKKLEISSMCTVFAETEVVGLVAREERVEDIIAAIHYSLARRTANMVMRIGIKEKVMMTGGVAKNIGILHYLKDFIGVPLIVAENPQIVGAVGAALIALERTEQQT